MHYDVVSEVCMMCCGVLVGGYMDMFIYCFFFLYLLLQHVDLNLRWLLITWCALCVLEVEIWGRLVKIESLDYLHVAVSKKSDSERVRVDKGKFP